MIDIKFIRANTETVRKAIVNKNEKADLVALLTVDESRRRLQYDFDTLKAEQNSVSQIIAQKKRAKEDATQELAQMAEVADRIKTLQAELSAVNAEMDNLLLTIPNVPQDNVPIGRDESCNEIIRHEGEAVQHDFEPRDHLEIATINGLLDLMRGAKISGSGFPYILVSAPVWNAP